MMITPREEWVRLCLYGLLIAGLRGLVVAQERLPEDYSAASTNFYYVSADEFEPTSLGTPSWVGATSGARHFNNPPLGGQASAGVRLPTGALMTGMSIIYEGIDPDGWLEIRLLREWWGIGTVKQGMIAPLFTSSGTPGIMRTYLDIEPDHTVIYLLNPLTIQAYRLLATMSDSGDLVQLRGVIIYWERQITPAPVNPTFPDVDPSYWAFQYVEALAASEITTGFPDGTLRPTERVTRAQMATFLARGPRPPLGALKRTR